MDQRIIISNGLQTDSQLLTLPASGDMGQVSKVHWLEAISSTRNSEVWDFLEEWSSAASWLGWCLTPGWTLRVYFPKEFMAPYWWPQIPGRTKEFVKYTKHCPQSKWQVRTSHVWSPSYMSLCTIKPPLSVSMGKRCPCDSFPPLYSAYMTLFHLRDFWHQCEMVSAEHISTQ